MATNVYLLYSNMNDMEMVFKDYSKALEKAKAFVTSLAPKAKVTVREAPLQTNVSSSMFSCIIYKREVIE